MKKILFLFAAAICTFAACDPVHEDISNGGHITVDDLKAKTSVTVDKDDNGKWGNVITCTTSAPVNAKWDIGGKEFLPDLQHGVDPFDLIFQCPDHGRIVRRQLG